MKVHLVEQGGRGGVFQHTVAVAHALAQTGLEVKLHTARDAEFDPSTPGVTVCRCVEWYRGRRFRRLMIGARYLGSTLPHLARDIRKQDIAHVQGVWRP